MGRYKLHIWFDWQIGFNILYDPSWKFIRIYFPFFTVFIGLDKRATDIRIFKKEF